MKKKIIDKISISIGIIVFVVMAYGIFSGLINLIPEQPDFVKYLIDTSFILAGVTFLSFFQTARDKFTQWIASSCWSFVLAGFFLFAFTTIPYSDEGTILTKLKEFNGFFGFFGLTMFCFGLILLLIILYLEQEKYANR